MTDSEDGRSRRARPSAERTVAALLAVVPLALAAIVYRDVPRIYFFADDFVHMLDIENVGFLRFVIQIFGGHIYFVRNLVFYAAYHLFGFDPRGYYWLALLTHLLNVWLVFRVTRRLTDGNAPLACLGASIWGASPLAAGTIGWFSVYGHEMVATVLLVVLDRILAADPLPSRGRLVCWALLTLAGMTCFGVGIGVALAFPVAVFLFLPATFRDARMRAGLLVFPLLVVGLYFGYRRLYPLLAPVPLSEAVLNNIALSQLAPIGEMLHHLLLFSVTALLSGFAITPERYPVGTPHWIVPVYLLGLLGAAIAGDWTTRRRMLALVVLCVAAYAMIALGRSNIYRTFKIEPWGAGRVIRYHYVGLIPITLALCIALEQLTRRLPVAAPVLLAAWLGFTAQRYQQSGWRVEDRADVRRWVALSTQKIELAIDLHQPGAMTIPNEDAPRNVLGPALGPMEFPGLAALFVLLHPDNVVRGRHVHFVEHRPGVYFKSRDPHWNRRLADLLVETDTVAQAPAAR